MNTNSVDATTPDKSSTAPVFKLAGLPWLSWLLLLASGYIALGPLMPTWDTNPNYSFGWWIPVVCVILFAERWPVRPSRGEAGSFRLVPLLIVWALLFLAFRMAGEADPDWRPGLWILVSLYVATLFAWLRLEGGIAWVRHFVFPVCFLFLCLPWPFQVEYPLTQGLMRWNAVLVADTLQMIGISAEPAGNIIQLQNCRLGVEEACSGILSLQASLVMGFLLGDIYHLTVRRRVLLILASALLALVGNYCRTFFLALMAFYVGADAVPRWHDTAGYAILIFTAIGTWLAALAIARGMVQNVPVVSHPSDDTKPERSDSLRFAMAIFAVALSAELITQAWFAWKETKLSRHPEWVAQFPAKSPSYKPMVLSEVTLASLRCDQSLGGEWQDDQGWKWSTYWFQYDPKPYTRIVLGWHVPDRCLPSVGMVKDRDYPDFTTTINGIDFLVHPKKFLLNDKPVFVFWVVYPLRGDIPKEYNYVPLNGVSSKFGYHLQDILNGYRGVGVETLEVALFGPKDYDQAKVGYLAQLKTMVMAGAVTIK